MTPLGKRQCGPCRACCVDLKIDVPELRKKAGVACGHLNGKGCGIYETRPSVCRAFLCGWRLLSELDDSWRPDRSGVLVIQRDAATVPEPWRAAGHGVNLMVVGGEDAIKRPGFVEYVVRLMREGRAVYLSTTAPMTLINDHLSAGEAARDLAATRAHLLSLYGLLQAPRWRRGLLFLLYYYRLEFRRQRRSIEEKLGGTAS